MAATPLPDSGDVRQGRRTGVREMMDIKQATEQEETSLERRKESARMHNSISG
jgi:hypothetical protein